MKRKLVFLLAVPCLLCSCGNDATSTQIYSTQGYNYLYPDGGFNPDMIPLENGLIADFENMESMAWYVSFVNFGINNMDYKASINNNEKYVSNNNGSLKLDFTFSKYNPLILPKLYFRIPRIDCDCDKDNYDVVFSFDIANSSTKSLQFSVEGLGSFSGGSYRYRYGQKEFNDGKYQIITVNNDDTLTHVECHFQVDFGQYQIGGGETAPIPRNLDFITLSLLTESDPNATKAENGLIYLDNVRLNKTPIKK